MPWYNGDLSNPRHKWIRAYHISVRVLIARYAKEGQEWNGA